MLYQHTAMALESLCEGDKIELLQGQSAVPAHRNLHNYLKHLPGHWCICSPVWLGEAGSALRDAASGLGWTSLYFAPMVVVTMDNSNADTWAHLVPYKNSIHAFQWLTETRVTAGLQSMGYTTAPVPDIKTIRVPLNADPLDMALSMHILARSPSPVRYRYKYPEDFVFASAHEDAQLKALVNTYWSLDMQDDLQQAILAGVLPGYALEGAPRLALPNLD